MIIGCYAALESSSWQATIGKKIAGVRVCDKQGYKISLLRALARATCKIVFLNFFLTYIFAFFNQRKRALHDIIANTLVVKAT